MRCSLIFRLRAGADGDHEAAVERQLIICPHLVPDVLKFLNPPLTLQRREQVRRVGVSLREFPFQMREAQVEDLDVGVLVRK